MTPTEVRALVDALRADLDAAESPADVEVIRRSHTGKKSRLKAAFKDLRSVPAERRPEVAGLLNQVREEMEAILNRSAETIERVALDRQLDAEWADLSLPGLSSQHGGRNPVTIVERECMNLLRRLGFDLIEGPEVEHPFYNFDALNIPKHHPARDMQDTFWVDGGLLLRSHTTTVQARVLQKKPELPIRVASLGRVYRNEAVDATHLAMFHQFEGFWVDRDLTFAHLKGILTFIARSLYGDSQRIRFKPKFYPYTEPSVGVDLACTSCDGAGCPSCHGAGWVTILGAGMIHPKVFLQFGYDPNKVKGIAFGLGTTRMASQWAGADRAKVLYEPDLRVHRRLHRRGR